MTIIAIALIALVIGFIFFSYWIPTIVGYPKAGKYISVILTLLILIWTLMMVFEDDMFSKNDAKKLLTSQGIHLNNDFEISENRFEYGFGDYYHTFSLKITTDDKYKIIKEMKNSLNFNKEDEVSSYEENSKSYHDGPKRFKNYETEEEYVKEIFEPRGQGHAPYHKRIEIQKKGNVLIFEDY